MNTDCKQFLLLMEKYLSSPIQDFKDFIRKFCDVCYRLPSEERDRACRLMVDYAKEHAFVSVEPLMTYSFYYNKLFDLAYDAFMSLSRAEKKEVKLGDVSWLLNYPVSVSRQEFNTLPANCKVGGNKSFLRKTTIQDTERFNKYLQILVEKGDPRCLCLG